MSLLAGLGNVLDIPGSMARDAINLRNPLDQLLDPFGQSNRTSGQEMLDQYGLHDSPWLSLGLEMALDPTTYIGAGAALKGAQGLGLVGKGLSAGKAIGRGAKALGKAARNPGKVIDTLAELPLKFKGRASQAVKGKAAQLQTTIASALGKGATAEEAVQVAAKADPAIDLTKHFGDINVMPGAGESFVSHQLPAAADDISSVLGHGHPNVSPSVSLPHTFDELYEAARKTGLHENPGFQDDLEIAFSLMDAKKSKAVKSGKQYTEAMKKYDEAEQVKSLLVSHGDALTPRLPPAQSHAFGQSPIAFDSTFAHGGGQFDSVNTLDQIMPTHAPAPQVSAPGPTKFVAAPFKGSQFLSSAMDRTVYNPDLLRMLLGGMAVNAAAHGRAQNPNSHAYMGMMQ